MKQLNQINEWVMSNKTKLYWIGGIILGLMVLYPLILGMPEFFLGLIGGVVLTLILKKFVLDKLVERRSIKLNVNKRRDESEPREPEPEPQKPTSTGNEGLKPDTKRRGIIIPSVSETGNGDGQIHDGSPTDEVERADEGHRDVQDTSDKPDDESERISEEPRSDSIRTDREDDSDSRESEQSSEERSDATGN